MRSAKITERRRGRPYWLSVAVAAIGCILVEGRGGVFLALPSTINADSPAFKHAAAACHFGAP